MKTASIACDNYKLAKFKKMLNKAGYPNFTVTAFTPTTSLIKVQVEDSKMPEFEKTVKKIEHSFHNSN